MAESDETTNNTVPYDEHGLYQVAMEKLAEGDEAGAETNLRLLADLFPEEQAIQDLLVRLQLKNSFAEEKHVAANHGQPRAILRLAVLGALAMAVCLLGIVAFTTARRLIVDSAEEEARQERITEQLRDSLQRRLEAEDWIGARQVAGDLGERVPDDPEALAAIELIEEGQARTQAYDDARRAEDEGDLDRALDLYGGFLEKWGNHGDVIDRIEALQKQQQLADGWETVQGLVDAEDWPGVIGMLTEMRRIDPDYRRHEVEDLLFLANERLALQLLAGARGDVDQIGEATQYMAEALRLRPASENLLEEYSLALKYLKGNDAAAQSDWATAVAHWEIAYNQRRDYQGGALESRLNEAYPQAARQLINQAEGDPGTLRQAVGYLDRAPAFRQGDEDLVQEHQMASEFLAGSEAFEQQHWDRAIAHWGPIYAVRPEYQNGALRSYLLEACDKSETPDEALCPP